VKRPLCRILLLALGVVLSVCQPKKHDQASGSAQPLSLHLLPAGAPGTENAILRMLEPDDYAELPLGPVDFAWDVVNFPMAPAGETEAAPAGIPHIRLVLNGADPVCVQGVQTALRLPEGRYLALSFLAQADGTCLKHPEAYALRQFTVGSGKPAESDRIQPQIFWNLPADTIALDARGGLMLDFYLLNTGLSEGGNTVRVHAGGEAFVLTEWSAYRLEGLAPGMTEIRLELLGPDGRPLSGPAGTAVRRVLVLPAPGLM
jgi:hypothetical protein